MNGVTWREWGGMLATCAMSGTVLGIAASRARMPHLPWPYLPFVVAGAIAGAFHPIVRALSPSEPVSSVLFLSGLAGASGALAGALIVPRCVPALRAREGLHTIVAP